MQVGPSEPLWFLLMSSSALHQLDIHRGWLATFLTGGSTMGSQWVLLCPKHFLLEVHWSHDPVHHVR